MYVYFIRHGEFVKIGKAKDTEERLADLQTGAPQRLFLLLKIRCRGDMHALEVEKLCHKLLKFCRHRGEWYRCGGVMGMINRLKRIEGGADPADIREQLWLAKVNRRNRACGMP